jgi:hypothetical protein
LSVLFSLEFFLPLSLTVLHSSGLKVLWSHGFTFLRSGGYARIQDIIRPLKSELQLVSANPARHVRKKTGKQYYP